MRTTRQSVASAVVTGLVASLLAVLGLAGPAQAAAVTPTFVTGNPTCQELGYDHGFKPTLPGDIQDVPGTYSDGIVTVTWAYSDPPAKTSVDWESDLPVAAVIVKAGNGAFLYDYEPPRTSDTDLATPDNSGGEQAELSHLVFCYDYAATVSKTATTSYERAYTWGILKDADATEVILSAGQSHVVNYSVAVTREAGTDSGFAVSGTITIDNPWPVELDLVSVADSLVTAGTGTLTCDGDTLAAGQTVTCEYSAPVATKDPGTNVATVETQYDSGPVRTATAEAPYTFGEPTTVTDDCVDVSDLLEGVLGTTCESKTYTYAYTVGPYAEPGEYEVPNTACAVTDDTATEVCDDHDVIVTVPDTGVGCTLTQGYWKTHSQFGPAPYDDAWANLGAAQQSTMFYTSGMSWYQLFWTPPRGGDVYIQLAHQYMAAKLNVLNGATAPGDLVTEAEAIFSRSTGTKLKATDSARAKTLAGLLDAYNNGVTGPGHCSE